MLHQYILAGDAKIGRTELNIGGYISGAYDDQLHIIMVGVEYQLATCFRIIDRHDVSRCQQRQRLLEYATFG